jgi:predicted nucleotidyltransferase
MVSQISPEEMKAYKRTARERWRSEQKSLNARRQHAWDLARQAAKLLKDEFNVARVAIFGSLIQAGRFTEWSDIDLVAWGLTSQNWLKAMAAVRQISKDIEINLIDVDTCSPELLAVIEREGMPL